MRWNIPSQAPLSLHEALTSFRALNRVKHVTVGGVVWQFIACGKGDETTLLLPRGTGLGEEWFPIIRELETDRRIIAPTYPLVGTMAQLVDGLAGILENEAVIKAKVLGVSFSGCVAQCFARAYPEKVHNLALSGTIVPTKSRTGGLKNRNRILNWLPLGLIRHLERRSIFKHLSTMPELDREFWETYFNEFVDTHLSRESLLRQNDCLIDFHENYNFSHEDLVNGCGAVFIPESDGRQRMTNQTERTSERRHRKAKARNFTALVE